MSEALIFLIETFTGLYLLLLVLRFWLPLLRANFRNAVAQGILRYTSPIVVPVRRVIPAVGQIDTATVLVALFVQMLASLLVLLILVGGEAIARIGAAPLAFVGAAFVELVSLSVLMFIIAIILRVVFSLIGRYFGPLSDLLNDLTEPLMRPVRRIIPPLGMIDLSAYVTIVLLIALNMVIADFRSMLAF